MMVTRLIQLVVSLWCLMYSFGCAAEDDYSKNICVKEANLECLQNNFDKLYQQNYQLFWAILHNAAKKAQTCDSIEDTAAFLRLVILKQSNAEFTEFFGQTVERLCVQKSICFLNGLLLVNQPTKVKLIDKLRSPLFVDSSEIDRVFLKARTNNKYREISIIYFLKE